MKFKALADNKSDVAKMMISIFDGVENNVGKGEYAGYQHFPKFFKPFFLFPQCFLQLYILSTSKCTLCGNGLNILAYKILACDQYHFLPTNISYSLIVHKH